MLLMGTVNSEVAVLVTCEWCCIECRHEGCVSSAAVRVRFHVRFEYGNVPIPKEFLL